MVSRRRPAWRAAVLLLAALTFARCSVGGTNRTVDLHGSTIEVLGSWSGTEQQRFEAVLSAFSRQTGATVTYTSAGHNVPAILASRVAGGQPPDVAFLPQPGLLRDNAVAGHLVPLDKSVVEVVARNYSGVWRDLASVQGRLYGVWFKAANKSLVWYDVGIFEKAGVVPPRDLDGFVTIARTLAAEGIPPLAVGAKDGWTLTDWFENVYLRIAGPGAYDNLAAHRLPWTDPTVKQALAVLARLLAPSMLAGGAAGALATSYEASVRQVFSTPPAAAMVFEGDFVAGVISGSTDAVLGVDADLFPFPSVAGSGPMVVGGGDVAVLLRDSPAGTALLRYLATPAAAAVWASQGGFVSPNRNVDLSVYPDAISRSVARSLLDAGDDFRFDLSDLQPSVFGSSATTGMRPILQAFLEAPDVDRTATELEAAAATAYAS